MIQILVEGVIAFGLESHSLSPIVLQMRPWLVQKFFADERRPLAVGANLTLDGQSCAQVVVEELHVEGVQKRGVELLGYEVKVTGVLPGLRIPTGSNGSTQLFC